MIGHEVIGLLRQARKLVQMPYHARVNFIADGLPILLGNSQGLYSASKAISDMHEKLMF